MYYNIIDQAIHRKGSVWEKESARKKKLEKKVYVLNRMLTGIVRLAIKFNSPSNFPLGILYSYILASSETV